MYMAKRTYTQHTDPLPYTLGERREVQHGASIVTQVFTRDGWWNITIRPEPRKD